ncbi:MAG: transglutaminase-like domain-containing protein [Ruminococcus flavefaciens]|nr:transglutaminase-like domain-containing protein [Ruminococcus flavefaciens]
MAKFMLIDIDNSKKAAIPRSKPGAKRKWKNPGAALYDQLLNANHIEGDIPTNAKDMKKAIDSGKYMDWTHLLKEAYLVAPVGEIKNSPYGVTPFSRSGCKYPHHVIKGNKLVISIDGLRSAWITARNQGVFSNHTQENKQIVAHLNRHCKELGLKPVWHHGEFYLMEESEVKIEQNFHDINLFLMEKTGVNLFDHCSDSVEMPPTNEYYIESVIEGPPENPVLSHDFDKEVGEKTPEALYNWMHKNIDYDNTIHGWKLRSAAQLYMDKKGNCHDQSYFTSLILHSWHYDNWQLFFIEFKKDDDRGGNTHTLTYYLDNGKFYWFENAWEDQTGIHGPYDSVEDVKQAVFNIYLQDDDINFYQYDGIVFSTFSNYRLGMNLDEYVRSWKLDDDRLFTAEKEESNIINQITESMDWVDAFTHSEEFREEAEADHEKKYRELSPSEIKEIDKKHSEKLVPIYGIIKSYSHKKLRNDGSEKTQSELNSIGFDKIIHKLTRGDNYSHALVSFDDTLTQMYSFEDEGFVEDNIETVLSWMGTKSIYICVMFVRESEKKQMEAFVKKLKEHQGETRYASVNLLKAFVGKPIKNDKRFVCSSFTGFILSCSNPKNLHRDYSRLRPEDITVLPRAFYLMNVKDAADFKARHSELKKKVADIFDEYKEEIDDYNNQLPKLLLKDRVDKLKTLDKILDWIIYRM